MKVSVYYSASFRYDAQVSLSPHVIRLFPRCSRYIRLINLHFDGGHLVETQFRNDLFDNLVACCFLPGERTHWDIAIAMNLEIEESNPFGFLLAPHALSIPFDYEPTEKLVLEPYISQRYGNFPLPPSYQVKPGTPTVEGLVTLNQSVFKTIAYQRRETGQAFTPEKTLSQGAGSCRDMAVLLAEILRRHHVATRLVSGFLWDSSEKHEHALHAWVEAYAPGAGWIGLDPTNGILSNHHHIPTAVGLTTNQISPIEGNYYAPTRVGSALDTSLAIQLHD